MTKRAEAKYKIDRRMGENIWGRPRSPFNKREYGPGQHGQRRKGKATDFGTQLKAKQKVKGYYGNISERQFHKYYVEALRLKGDSSANLIGLLERRLDALDLPRQVRADGVRGPPVRQPRPHQGQRPAGQHRLLSGEGRRPDRDQGILAPAAAGARGTRSPSGTCPTMSRSITPRARPSSPAFPGSPKCPIRRTWSRTWSSSSIRADDSLRAARRRASSPSSRLPALRARGGLPHPAPARR